MLVRIVRMTFKADKVDDFLKVFEESKHKIRAFDGCRHLELHRDYHKKNVFSTYSHWIDDAALDGYRHSDLFKGVWAQTKALFDEKPIAFSNQKIDEVTGSNV
ncbi:antibiotic biosynthesis monooxygenase [Fulvivirga sp. RKSG066]|uniref:putative quinol monooxygenase n=1 Tax=Fulvivirga aurantia TaxID=2529383 RepID=UPI0012BCBD02|nr:antibiotic biosynthesis monooxygenase [Fulvivirga aurantia]MTI19716.1 antibiotic biosynthesis monooxygenase [Fulvivirga aurantia]